MNILLRDFWNTLTPDQKKQFAVNARTTVGYMRLLVGGYRTPSRKMAERLANASKGVLDRTQLIFGNEYALQDPEHLSTKSLQNDQCNSSQQL